MENYLIICDKWEVCKNPYNRCVFKAPYKGKPAYPLERYLGSHISCGKPLNPHIRLATFSDLCKFAITNREEKIPENSSCKKDTENV